ncbi:MAG: iron-sulfur cluster assembly accessory protein [Planctomycetes bacterium]|jgi:iron-sulfur cluster assembly protein|nr:iron-sulfur cluster assembly accessory protein [Planctomycetota bacterium]
MSEPTLPTAKAAPATQPKPSEPKPGRGVHLTERAAKEILRVIGEQNFPASTHVRIGAKGGGCSGFTYVLDFDQNGPTEFDLSFVQHGVNLVVDKKSEFFMGGTILDFNDGLLDRGFVFKNPQASGTCGCGTSFSA